MGGDDGACRGGNGGTGGRYFLDGAFRWFGDGDVRTGFFCLDGIEDLGSNSSE